MWDWANLGLNLFIRFIWALLVRFWVWAFWFGFEFGSFLFIGLKHAFGFFICTIALFFCFCVFARVDWPRQQDWHEGGSKKDTAVFSWCFFVMVLFCYLFWGRCIGLRREWGALSLFLFSSCWYYESKRECVLWDLF